MKNLFLLMPVLALTACATVHGPGNFARPIEGKVTPAALEGNPKGDNKTTTAKGLLVSGSENTSLASEYFTMVDLTFENKSSDWLRVTKVEIDFGNTKANSDIRFPVGQDLMDWAQSAQKKKAIRDYNMSLALSAIAGTGLAMSGHSSESTRNAGRAMAAGSGMILAAKSISTELDSLQKARVIPEDHLLSGNFSVPPGLFTKKWITFYAKSPKEVPYVQNLALTLTYDNGTTESVVLNLREMQKARSDWQANHPEIEAAKKAARGKNYDQFNRPI